MTNGPQPLTVRQLVAQLQTMDQDRKVLIQVCDDCYDHSHLYLYTVREEEIGIEDEGEYDEDACEWTPQPVVLLEYE